jgi:hypothetical protein
MKNTQAIVFPAGDAKTERQRAERYIGDHCDDHHDGAVFAEGVIAAIDWLTGKTKVAPIDTLDEQ